MIEEVRDGRLLLRSHHLGREALHKLSRMREDGVLLDIRIRVRGGEDKGEEDEDGDEDEDEDAVVVIPAHKLVLCVCSPYFEAMFGGGGFVERHRDEVDMKGKKKKILLFPAAAIPTNIASLVTGLS